MWGFGTKFSELESDEVNFGVFERLRANGWQGRGVVLVGRGWVVRVVAKFGGGGG